MNCHIMLLDASRKTDKAILTNFGWIAKSQIKALFEHKESSFYQFVLIPSWLKRQLVGNSNWFYGLKIFDYVGDSETFLGDPPEHLVQISIDMIRLNKE